MTMDEIIYKNFSKRFYNKLKNTVNASVLCTVNEDEDKLNIEFNRLGLQYKTSVKNLSEVIESGEAEAEIEFDKVIKRYKTFIHHKFFF